MFGHMFDAHVSVTVIVLEQNCINHN
jgi:hypothetical protein